VEKKTQLVLKKGFTLKTWLYIHGIGLAVFFTQIFLGILPTRNSLSRYYLGNTVEDCGTCFGRRELATLEHASRGNSYN